MKLPEKLRDADFDIYSVDFYDDGSLYITLAMPDECHTFIREKDLTNNELCELFNSDNVINKFTQYSNNPYFYDYLINFYNRSDDKLKLLIEINIGNPKELKRKVSEKFKLESTYIQYYYSRKLLDFRFSFDDSPYDIDTVGLNDIIKSDFYFNNKETIKTLKELLRGLYKKPSKYLGRTVRYISKKATVNIVKDFYDRLSDDLKTQLKDEFELFGIKEE